MNSQDKRYRHLFETEKLNRDVKKKSIKAGVANFTSQGVSLGVTLIRAAILARLLSPEDYGVFTMVVVISSFAIIFKDIGLGMATVREKKINHGQVSNLFWINTLIGFLSMLIIIALSPAMVWFYNEPRLYNIAGVLSLGFLFSGMTVQHQALLRRQMQFNRIAVITVISAAVSSSVGIAVAVLTKNYWALVWMQVAHNLFLMIGFWLSTGWIPDLPSKNNAIRNLLNVGLDVAGLNAFSTITQQLDKIIIGRISSAGGLGLYNKGHQVPHLISGQFRLAFFSIALPALSALQSEKDRFRGYYYKFLNIVCWSTMTLSSFCFVFADEIILVYFGPKWADSVIFMKIFSIHAFIMPAMTTLDQIPLALGFSRRYLLAGMARSVALIICIITTAPFFGVLGIAWSIVLSEIIAFLPFIKLCLKESPVTIKGYFSTIFFPVLTTLSIAICFHNLKIQGVFHGHCAKLLAMSAFLAITVIVFIILDYFNSKGSAGIVRAVLKRLNKLGTA
jgi:O-antigen/teichoic acid export membrane protein